MPFAWNLHILVLKKRSLLTRSTELGDVEASDSKPSWDEVDQESEICPREIAKPLALVDTPQSEELLARADDCRTRINFPALNKASSVSFCTPSCMEPLSSSRE
eukprot:CAMPEP_0178416310 /NCGR_PEP_ID=MMETSP0689_2-20121128/23999_1 /TAXON_ID=160604 /ORGANISM="Amphidinium massartii, Strain CS-259" /LENGTH=103 /DNA_ID=CAMNT_0020037653 /DNA_START=274 /DNA_END=585 /DNA_ORIENTATION=+